MAKCCPTCGRALARPHKTKKFEPTTVLTEQERAALSITDLYEYYRVTAFVQDLLFYRPGCSPALQAHIDALIARGNITRPDVHAVFDRWRHEAAPVVLGQPKTTRKRKAKAA